MTEREDDRCARCRSVLVNKPQERWAMVHFKLCYACALVLRDERFHEVRNDRH